MLFAVTEVENIEAVIVFNSFFFSNQMTFNNKTNC